MMRKRWISRAFLISICISLLVPAGPIKAADSNVKVTLPTFDVKLNGHTVENQYRQYPLLVYRGITYFPMTWDDTRLLGLEATWTQESGLNIKQSPVSTSYAPYKTSKSNASAYNANIAASVITVNGKAINNTKEKYPLLTFRNVTYFPLTWRFAHDEFGWDYKWDAASGLSITSHNPQLQPAGLPAYAVDNDIAVFNGYYYFVQMTGTKNHIYRAPINQPSAKEEIYSYSLEGSDEAWNPVKVTFQVRDNALWFRYHLGGGVSGSDQYVKINDNGKAELLHDGYLDFRETPYGTLIVRLGSSAFEGGNLYLSLQGEQKKVGDSDLMYAVTRSGSSWSLAGGDTSYIAVNGNDAYVLASRNEADANSIYRINLKTNKTEKIVSSGVSFFQVAENRLYYVKDRDKALYSSNLDGTKERKLSDNAAAWFGLVDGNLFYTTEKNANQFELYKIDLNGEDTLVWASPITGVQVSNNKLICRISGSDNVILLDGSGRLRLKVEEPISRIFTSDKELLLYSAKLNGLAIIR
ncbi:DUF5050 domain-containing protein [Paenibacillus nanensis]|nr:DUF5050 domain-containing protein [Paenibacillus nanensis]